MIKKISVIGTGKVAYHFAKEIFNNTHLKLIQIVGRSKNLNPPFNKFKNLYSNDFSLIQKSDFCIVAVSDDSIKEVSKNIKNFNGIILHTSGSIDLSVLNNHLNSGVIYPFQTFSFNRNINLKKVPFLVEGSSKRNLKEIILLSKIFSENVIGMKSDKRLVCHLSGIFANNFINHLISNSEGILKKFNISSKILNPLIQETFSKLKSISSADAQTGPATRNDLKTIKKHLRFLKDNNLNNNADIYRALSDSIIKTKLDKK